MSTPATPSISTQKETPMSTTTPSTPVQKLFDFKGAEVRTMTENGEPWFVLSDVCKILGIKNVGDAKTRLDQADIGQTDVWSEANGRNYSVATVNERGLYMTIMRSDKPQALDFQMWISGEVIPSIRKHGAYLTSEKIEEVLLNPDTIIQIAQNLKEEQQARLEAEKKLKLEAEARKVAQEQIEANRPKVDAFDALIAKGESEMIGTVGKTLGIGQNKLFQFLRDEEILISKGQRKNIPYQKYAKYFDVKQRLVKTWDGKEIYQATTYVKPSGMDFIRKRLVAAGIIK